MSDQKPTGCPTVIDIHVDDKDTLDALAEALQAHVRETTAPYKYPRRIIFRDALPKTISGKIRRVELRAEVED